MPFKIAHRFAGQPNTGHSLGAHICGYAGRHYTSLTNVLLPRITGLDPARPCFNEGEQLSGLQRGDASFVDIIHSNAGILGIKESRGDVDFFPNGYVVKQHRKTKRFNHFVLIALSFIFMFTTNI